VIGTIEAAEFGLVGGTAINVQRKIVVIEKKETQALVLASTGRK
jgi:hypothetical protein